MALVSQILKELNEHGIQIFRIPECDSDEDEQYRKKDQEIKVWPICRPASLTLKFDFVALNVRGHTYTSSWTGKHSVRSHRLDYHRRSERP